MFDTVKRLLKKAYWWWVNFWTICSYITYSKYGKATVYKKVTDFTGSKVSFADLYVGMENFTAVALKDEKGNQLILSHGNPDGSMKTNAFSLYQQGLRGNWILISCFNAMRGDFNGKDFQLIREPNTISNDEIGMTIIKGDLYLSIDPALVFLTRCMRNTREYLG